MLDFSLMRPILHGLSRQMEFNLAMTSLQDDDKKGHLFLTSCSTNAPVGSFALCVCSRVLSLFLFFLFFCCFFLFVLCTIPCVPRLSPKSCETVWSHVLVKVVML